jgi:protein SCO1
MRASDCCIARRGIPTGVSGTSIYQLGGSWIDDGGRAVNLDIFRGRPVVLAMFFTGCSNACPLTVAEMVRIRAALPMEIRSVTVFVLVSFDSENDGPAALRAYREEYRLDPAGWSLLNGPPDDVRALAMVLGVQYTKTGPGQFSHSSAISVLNDRGEIVFQASPSENAITASVVAAVAHNATEAK